LAGINRKLTPMDYQNKLKEGVINRAVQTTNKTITANSVSDYKIKYQSRICWDFPFLTDLALAILQKINLPVVADLSQYTHYCIYTNNAVNIIKANIAQAAFTAYNLSPFIPFKINFQRIYSDKEATLTEMNTHKPPSPNDPDYEKNWTNWSQQEKNPLEPYGKWYYLWSTVPLASREDTQGRIKSEAARKAKDSYNIDKYSFMQSFTSVPHVARLFELSSNVQKMLRNTTSVLGEETTLLTQGSGSFSLGLELKLPSGNTPGLYNMDAYVSIASAPKGCDFLITDNQLHVSYSTGGHCDIVGRGANLDQNPVRINDLGNCNSPSVYMNIGDSYSINVVVDITDVGGPNCSGWNSPISASCTMTLTANGFVSTCSGATAPPPPACGLASAPNITNCEKPALTDSNPNDQLCCNGTLRANLEAVDQVINPDYTPCIETLEDGTVRYNPDCFTSLKIPVSRKIAVNLGQPYLKQIWDATANPTSGVFNLFRPSNYPKFSPLEAKSKEKVKYEYDNGKGTGTVSPGEGDFYFPYLGGVQQAKEQTIRSLTPYKPYSQ